MSVFKPNYCLAGKKNRRKVKDPSHDRTVMYQFLSFYPPSLGMRRAWAWLRTGCSLTGLPHERRNLWEWLFTLQRQEQSGLSWRSGWSCWFLSSSAVNSGGSSNTHFLDAFFAGNHPLGMTYTLLFICTMPSVHIHPNEGSFYCQITAATSNEIGRCRLCWSQQFLL